MMAEITVAEHSGFCYGVTRAVETAHKEIESAMAEGRKLFCLGQLIHNKIVTEELAAKGLITINSIDEAEDGSVVLIRAHGEPDSTYKRAAEKNIRLIDATCPFVERIHKIARDAAAQGRRILVIGDANHPEVKGIIGSAGGLAGSAESPEETQSFIDGLCEGGRIGPLLTIVAQTTISAERFEACTAVVTSLAHKLADINIENTICNATRQRQNAAAELARQSDIMVVIGDSYSSNSKKLFEICKKHCKNVVFAEKTEDLPLLRLKKYNKIGVAASASAPERIIKEVVANMSDEVKNLNNEAHENEAHVMEAYMDEIEKSLKLPGRNEVVDGTVVQVTEDYVVVNLGCKKDGMLPKEEVALEEGRKLADAFKEGDEIQTKVIKTDDGDGNILLSKKKLQSGENWNEIIAAADDKETISVTVVREVRGGVIAGYKEVSGFIPMSQLADRYVETAEEFIGKTLPVKVSRVDQRRNKAVFSHKAFLNEERNKRIAQIWETLNVGDIVEGKVMRFTDYGAFVDIGGIDGLLHISEISWGKLKHPQEVLHIGQILNIKILSMNPEKGKISLGLKQNTPEPWSVIDEQYQVGQVIKGKVVQIKEYGAFIELSPGLDGLAHISEIAHKRVNKVSDELTIGQEVDAKILEIDKERRRISLSIKATLPEPQIYEDKGKAPAEEVPPESPIEASAETAEASTVETPTEVSEESSLETVTLLEAPAEAAKESLLEVPDETVKEAPVEASSEAAKESSLEVPDETVEIVEEASLEAPVEVTTDTSEESPEVLVETPAEAAADTLEEISWTAPAETQIETPAEALADASEEAPVEEAEESSEETADETVESPTEKTEE